METAVETFDPGTAGVRVRAMVRPVLLLLVETFDPGTASVREISRPLRRRLAGAGSNGRRCGSGGPWRDATGGVDEPWKRSI